ncbi:dispersed gene family protein 1 (DGF-1), putative, partial [Bodo saltans]
MPPFRMFPHITTAALLVLLLTVFPIPPVNAQKRYVLNGGTYSTTWTITAPYAIVEIHNAVFNGVMGVVIDIAGMISTTHPVWVVFCNCVFNDGASIYLGGAGGIVDSYMPVYVTLEGLTFNSGGLGFKGYWPPHTRIVIAHCNVYINSRVALLPLWGQPFYQGNVDGRMAYWMSFSNFYLRTQSSVLFTGCFLGGTWPSGTGVTATASIVINLDYVVSLYDRSTFWIRNTTTTKVFMLHTYGNFYADSFSSMVIENMTMICDRFCISWDAGTVQFSGSSAFVLADSSASVPLGEEGEDLWMTRSVYIITTSSAFIIKNNILSPYRYAFSMDASVSFTVSTNSIASFYLNSVAGTPWKLTILTNNGGVALAQCNNLAGAPMRLVSQYQTAGLTGLTAASPCPRRTTDCQYQNSSCLMSGSTGVNADCTCECNSNGLGPDCIGTVRPLYVNQCIETASLLPTLTAHLTQTEKESGTRTIEEATHTHF